MKRREKTKDEGRRTKPCHIVTLSPCHSSLVTRYSSPCLLVSVVVYRLSSYPGNNFRQAVLTAQLEALDLAGGCLGQLGDELDPARPFVGRHLLRAIRDQLLVQRIR